MFPFLYDLRKRYPCQRGKHVKQFEYANGKVCVGFIRDFAVAEKNGYFP